MASVKKRFGGLFGDRFCFSKDNQKISIKTEATIDLYANFGHTAHCSLSPPVDDSTLHSVSDTN